MYIEKHTPFERKDHNKNTTKDVQKDVPRCTSKKISQQVSFFAPCTVRSHVPRSPARCPCTGTAKTRCTAKMPETACNTTCTWRCTTPIRCKNVQCACTIFSQHFQVQRSTESIDGRHDRRVRHPYMLDVLDNHCTKINDRRQKNGYAGSTRLLSRKKITRCTWPLPPLLTHYMYDIEKEQKDVLRMYSCSLACGTSSKIENVIEGECDSSKRKTKKIEGTEQNTKINSTTEDWLIEDHRSKSLVAARRCLRFRVRSTRSPTCHAIIVRRARPIDRLADHAMYGHRDVRCTR